jgi:hypothetical protein
LLTSYFVLVAPKKAKAELIEQGGVEINLEVLEKYPQNMDLQNRSMLLLSKIISSGNFTFFDSVSLFFSGGGGGTDKSILSPSSFFTL